MIFLPFAQVQRILFFLHSNPLLDPQDSTKPKTGEQLQLFGLYVTSNCNERREEILRNSPSLLITFYGSLHR